MHVGICPGVEAAAEIESTQMGVMEAGAIGRGARRGEYGNPRFERRLCGTDEFQDQRFCSIPMRMTPGLDSNATVINFQCNAPLTLVASQS